MEMTAEREIDTEVDTQTQTDSQTDRGLWTPIHPLNLFHNKSIYIHTYPVTPSLPLSSSHGTLLLLSEL